MVQINPLDYVNQKLANGTKPQLYAKTARITARPGKIGEEVITKTTGGGVSRNKKYSQRSGRYDCSQSIW